MTKPIPDYTETEQKLVSTALFERYGKLVPFQLADSELQLDASSDELTIPRWSITAPAMTSTTARGIVS